MSPEHINGIEPHLQPTRDLYLILKLTQSVATASLRATGQESIELALKFPITLANGVTCNLTSVALSR